MFTDHPTMHMPSGEGMCSEINSETTLTQKQHLTLRHPYFLVKPLTQVTERVSKAHRMFQILLNLTMCDLVTSRRPLATFTCLSNVHGTFFSSRKSKV